MTHMKKWRRPSVLKLISVLSDTNNFDNFKTIATSKEGKIRDSNIHCIKVKPNSEQYRSSIASLINARLIKRKRTDNGYCLTEFGKQVYQSQNIIKDAINAYLKLKALDDSIEKSDELAKEAVSLIMDSFYR